MRTCALILFAALLAVAAVSHKGASKVAVKTQAVSIAPPTVQRSLTTAKGTKAARVYTNPFNVAPNFPTLSRTNQRVEYESWPTNAICIWAIESSTDTLNWSDFTTTTNREYFSFIIGNEPRFFRARLIDAYIPE